MKPINPGNCTVNGYIVKETDPDWTGLDFTNCELRHFSIWGEDYHLRVPWWHPEDGPAPNPPEMYYRVRPKSQSDTFYQDDGVWFIVRKNG